MCTIIPTYLEPIHQPIRWRPGRVGNAEIELYPILATAAPCIYQSLAIANKEFISLNPTHGSTLLKKKDLAWSRLACMLRSRYVPPSPRSAPSSKLSQLYVPVSAVSRAERCKPCPVALIPTLGCSQPLLPSLLLLASALSGNIIPGYFEVCLFVRGKKGPYTRTRLVTPQEKN